MDGQTTPNVKLTAWENHPNKVHKEVVNPEVQELRSAVSNLLIVMIEHAGGIVKDEAVDLSNRNDNLKRVTKRMLSSNECSNDEAQWAPGKLFVHTY